VVPELEKVNEIVVDMLSHYALTNVFINMDNLYFSPVIAKMLAKHAICCRGTTNKRHFLKVVI
jgi:hypothetical protein